jgi:transcriptional regulator with XRE-family HTH domain
VPINGRVLAELRWLAGMDQADLANASCVETAQCKLTEGNISAYEREAKRPTAANLAAMLKALRKQLAKRGLELTAAHVRALIRTPTLDLASSNGSAGQEGPANRRQASKTIVLGGFAAALAPRNALERIMSHGDRPLTRD